RNDRVAVATYVADEEEGYYGQVLHARYRSTDTWLLTDGSWQMIASQVLALRDDPPAVDLAPAALDAYVGRYALTPAVTYTIARDGTTLRGQRTGRNEEALKVEVPDVLFVPGQPRLRKIFKRDSTGRITGFVERRESWISPGDGRRRSADRLKSADQPRPRDLPVAFHSDDRDVQPLG